jgi:pyruvate dehydrogenase E2 component (dihydrolipoamide acetyltransferase)
MMMPQLEVAGETLSYLKAGQGERVILLVHGFASDARSWGLNQPALGQNATVYAIDLPGHGQIPASDIGGLDRLAEILRAAVMALSPERPVHLVGHSMGGAIALRAASTDPHLVRALTLIAPAGIGAGFNTDFLAGLLAMTDEASARVALQSLVANPSILSPQIVTGILAARDRPHTYAAWERMAAVGAEIWDYRAESRAALAALRLPVQVIWGAQDAVLPPPESPLPEKAVLHRLPGFGHVPHMEGFRQVNRLIAEFDAAGT